MRKISGFTLIELMIVVAIAAILAGIAFPSYQNHVTKARRSAAQQLLLGAAQKEEQYIVEMRQYTDNFAAMNFTQTDWDCTTDTAVCSNNFYDVQITVDNAVAPPTYTITATAKGSQVDDGDLSLDSTGARTGEW